MSTLFILNDPPYGTERVHNALGIVGAVPKADPNARVTVFPMADVVAAAKSGQKSPRGYGIVELMLQRVVAASGAVPCGTCLDARGLASDQIVEGARRGAMDDLARAAAGAGKVLVL